MKKLNFFYFLFACSLFLACSSNTKKLDNTTSGEINFGVDETLSFLGDAEKAVFEGTYSKAKVNPIYAPENEIFDLLLKDSVRFVISSRELNEDEKSYFKKINITPRSTKIAHDAIALICNVNNKDTLITIPQLKQILKGEIKTWNQLNPSSPNKPIQLIFDNSKSSTVRYLMELADIKSFQGTKIYSLDSNKAVINYIKNDKFSIGVIGVNYISDFDDTTSIGFLKGIHVMGVAEYAGAVKSDYIKPFQAFIAQKSYPLTREVYAVSREARAGLGNGFIAFIASDRGQRIILKMGLVPAIAPVRLVEINTESPFK